MIVITGGSRGIGAAVASLAAARGERVAINYASDERAANAVVASIRAAGGSAIALRGDVSRESDVVALFESAERELGPATGLVNNAGIGGTIGPFEELSLDEMTRVFEINVFGAMLCAREAVRRMSTRRGGAGGSIVNVSSRAAELGGANEWLHYAASKGALDTFTRGLGREVARDGIRVNAVAPGLIETEIHARSGDGARLERLAAMIPMGRAGSANEVAEAVLWLLSPAASYVTSTILDVGGGR